MTLLYSLISIHWFISFFNPLIYLLGQYWGCNPSVRFSYGHHNCVEVKYNNYQRHKEQIAWNCLLRNSYICEGRDDAFVLSTSIKWFYTYVNQQINTVYCPNVTLWLSTWYIFRACQTREECMIMYHWFAGRECVSYHVTLICQTWGCVSYYVPLICHTWGCVSDYVPLVCQKWECVFYYVPLVCQTWGCVSYYVPLVCRTWGCIWLCILGLTDVREWLWAIALD